MKFTFSFLFMCFFLITSCKKETKSVYKAGDTDNHTVIHHDTTTQISYYGNGHGEGNLGIDVDDDQLIDFYFSSTIDSTYFFPLININGVDKFVGHFPWQNYQINLSISDSIQTKKNANSTILFQTIEDTIFDFYGTFPRITEVIEQTYSPTLNGASLYRQPSIKHLQEGDPILNLTGFEQIDYCTIYHNEYFQSQWYFSGTGYNDSLIGFTKHSESKPGGLPLNQIVFIPFKMIKNGKKYPGWIELKISEQFKITVYRSAISNLSEDEI